MATSRNYATGSTKRGLRAIAGMRQVPVVVIEEHPIDARSYGITEEEAERGSELHLLIGHPHARAIVDRIGYTHGSSWETDGNTFAYNIVTVWSEKELKEVLKELKRDGLVYRFVESPLPRTALGGRSLVRSSHVGLKRQQRKLTRSNLKRRAR